MSRRIAVTVTIAVALLSAGPVHAAPASAPGGVGTAEEWITGLGITVEGGYEVKVIDTGAWSTTDPGSREHEEPVARTEFMPVHAVVGTDHVHAPDPYVRSASQDGARDDWGTLGDATITLPSGQPVTVAPPSTAPTLPEQRLLGASFADLVLAGEGEGSVARGVVHVGQQSATLDPQRADTLAHSEIASLELLSGLARVSDAGLGDHETVVHDEHALARTREVKVGELRLLDVDALLRLLGLDLELLNDATLALLADALGIPTTDTVGSFDPRAFESWHALQATVGQTKETLMTASGLGTACDGLDELAAVQHSFDFGGALDALGVERPDCLGALDALTRLHETLDALSADLRGLLASSLHGAVFMEITDFSSNVRTVARVDEEGRPHASTDLGGGVGRIRVGAEDVGHVDVKTHSSVWNDTEDTVNSALDDLFTRARLPFEGLVRVRIMPRLVEQTYAQDGYAVAEAELTVLQVDVTVPSDLPEPEIPDPREAVPDDLLVAPSAPAAPPALSDAPVETEVELERLELASAVSGRSGDETVSFTLGSMRARAAHARPGVDFDCDDLCGSGDDGSSQRLLRNETWHPRLGFGPGADATLPRTGGASTLAWSLVLVGGAVALRPRLAGRCDRPHRAQRPQRTQG